MNETELAEFIRTDLWFDSKDFHWMLYGLARGYARRFPGMRVLEIGTREGSTAVPLLAGIQAGSFGEAGKLVSVDNDTDIKGHVVEVARVRVANAGLGHLWELHLADSHAWESPYPDYLIIFIDGDHSYWAVKADFEKYSKMLAPNGIILMHDAQSFDDVRKFIQEVNLGDWMASVIPIDNGLAVINRRSDWVSNLPYQENYKW